jgi:hypothetical protein
LLAALSKIPLKFEPDRFEFRTAKTFDVHASNSLVRPAASQFEKKQDRNGLTNYEFVLRPYGQINSLDGTEW